jgi:hypothetical protein
MKENHDGTTAEIQTLDSIQQPPVITYNLKDRGRQHTGQPRNFNTSAICDSVNGPATQEKVKSRGMLGYFGHKLRLLAGLEPSESVVIGGKYNEIEPAIITTNIEAMPDGTIKHKTEFLDTEPGRKAARLWSNKIGGFSSVINEKTNELIGFDFVLQPNFNGNRGFSLDSVEGLTFDSVMAEAQAEEESDLIDIIEQKNAELKQAEAAMDSLRVENEQLLSMLASGKTDVALDSAAIMPTMVSIEPAERMKKDAQEFRTARLPVFVEQSDGNGGDGSVDMFMNRMGY